MNKLVFILILTLLVSYCKKETSTENPIEEKPQILGYRYSDSFLNIYSKPASTKKTEQVGSIYALEEVTGLEVSEEKGKKYLKLKTVDGKEGYAPLERFYEAVYVTVSEGLTAFKKPTLTAPIQGKIDKAAICYIKEVQAEWGNANCSNAKYEFGTKPESYYNVWIQLTETALSKDPTLAQTAMTIREATNAIAKLSTSKDIEKTKLEIKKHLDLAIEKQDLFSSYAQELLDKVNSYSTESTESVPNPDQVPNQEPSEPKKTEEEQLKPAG